MFRSLPAADFDKEALTILAGEMTRAIEFGKNALNPSSVTELERLALRFGMDFEQLAGSGYEDD